MTDRLTDRQKDRQNQINKQTEGPTNRQKDWQTDGQTACKPSQSVVHDNPLNLEFRFDGSVFGRDVNDFY